MNKTYVEQVKLLIRTLPIVAEQDCFALHGGTAINLFIKEMPRLSVDIDLTFVHLSTREVALEKIRAALRQIRAKIISEIPRECYRARRNGRGCEAVLPLCGQSDKD